MTASSPLDAYAYDIPTDLIAHTPIEPRDHARLLVYNTATDTIVYTTVRDLPILVPQSHFVFNNTTVLPARLTGIHCTQPIEVLVLVDQGVTSSGEIRALVNRYVEVGDTIAIDSMVFTVIDNREKAMRMRVELPETAFYEALTRYGETPLPPYIKSPVSELEKRQSYQTMFATSAPSVAAPTASLHFTPALMAALRARGVTTSAVTLQVGLGTFAPVFADNFVNKKLHEEYYVVDAAAAGQIQAARADGRAIVAVGTTVVRTLESAKDSLMHGQGKTGVADLFIFPPYEFVYPDVLMTNFHVPKSSLMCLVQAFIEHKGGTRHITDIYHEAIGERYRFYSFGDAMLVI